MQAFRHLYGPVASRRFGRSLGIDLQRPGEKTCTLNCVFCQLGPTPCLTVERQPLVPIEEVIAELDTWCRGGGQADCVTLAGSGEPTLHPDFGAILSWVRRLGRHRSLLLSNGTLFSLPQVRGQAGLADAVKVSLHAWDEPSFQRIVHPHPSLRLAEILEGYRRFREEYAGEFIVEVFLVPGLNDRPAEVKQIADLLRGIRPTRIQLNTATRPPAEESVAAVPGPALAGLAPLFTPAAEVPPAAAGATEPRLHDPAALTEEVARIVQRHPASAASLAATLGAGEARVMAALRELSAANRIAMHQVDGEWIAGPRR